MARIRGGPEGLPGNAGQTHPIQFVRTPVLPEREHRRQALRQRGRRRSTALSAPRPSRNSVLRIRGCSEPAASPITRIRATATRSKAAVRTTRRCPISATSRRPPTPVPARGAVPAATRSTTTSSATSPTRPTTTPSAEVRVARKSRVLHQLGRVPELAQLRRRQLRPVPAAPIRRGTTRSPAGWRRPAARRRPTYNAYRMPLYMPKTSFSRSQAVTVWGEARPAQVRRQRTGRGRDPVPGQRQGSMEDRADRQVQDLLLGQGQVPVQRQRPARPTRTRSPTRCCRSASPAR